MAYNMNISCYAYEHKYLTVIAYPVASNINVFGPIFNGESSLLFYDGVKDSKENIAGYYRLHPTLGWVHYKFNNAKQILDVANGPNNTIAVLSHINGFGALVSITSDYKTWSTRHVGINDHYNFILNSSEINETKGLIVYSTYQNFPKELENTIYSSKDGLIWIETRIPTIWNAMPWSFRINNKYTGGVFNKFISLQSMDNHDITKLIASDDLINWDKIDIPFGDASVQKAFNRGNLFAVVVKNGQKKQQKLWVTFDFKTWANFLLPYNMSLNDLQLLDNNQILMLFNYENYYPDTEIYNAYETELVILNTDNHALKVIQKFDGNIRNLIYKNNKLYLSGDFINPEDGIRSIMVVSDNAIDKIM